MKKQIVSNRIQKTIVRVAFAFVLMVFVPSAHATDGVKSPSNIAVTYVGSIESQPVFQIEFDNKDEATFLFTIKDEDGNILYTEKSKDRKYSKKFRYQGEENVKLTFTVTTPENKQSEVYQVNTSTRMVQDVIVTRL